MNAIDFLMKEHEKVRKILSDIENNSHHYETKRKMFDELGIDLIRHEEMEHKVWYPHFKNDTHLSNEVRHLLKEENYAKKAIKQLSELKTQSLWEEKFIKFKKDVEHHAQEEEQQLFPEVEKLLDTEELEKIGIEMHHFKQNYSQ